MGSCRVGSPGPKRLAGACSTAVVYGTGFGAGGQNLTRMVEVEEQEKGAGRRKEVKDSDRGSVRETPGSTCCTREASKAERGKRRKTRGATHVCHGACNGTEDPLRSTHVPWPHQHSVGTDKAQAEKRQKRFHGQSADGKTSQQPNGLKLGRDSQGYGSGTGYVLLAREPSLAEPEACPVGWARPGTLARAAAVY